MRSMDSTYSSENKIEQPIDCIDSDTPTLIKNNKHKCLRNFYKYGNKVMCVLRISGWSTCSNSCNQMESPVRVTVCLGFLVHVLYLDQFSY